MSAVFSDFSVFLPRYRTNFRQKSPAEISVYHNNQKNNFAGITKSIIFGFKKHLK
jgi:hypothetical protein